MTDTTAPTFAATLAAYDRALAAALDAARDHLGGVTERPVSRVATWDQMRAALDEPLPVAGCAPEAALAEWLERAAPGIVGSVGPRFFGWVIGVTFYGPQIARAINAPEAKVHRPRSMDSSTNHPTNYQPNE